MLNLGSTILIIVIMFFFFLFKWGFRFLIIKFVLDQIGGAAKKKASKFFSGDDEE